MRRGRMIRFMAWVAGITLILLLALILIFKFITRVPEPAIPASAKTAMTRISSGDTVFTCEKGWLKKSGKGWWLMYLEGSPYEVGYAHGLLTRELLAGQEKAFTGRLAELLPARLYQRFMLGFVRYFNRNLDRYVLPEYQQEIFAISRSAPADYIYIGPAYARMLNYHAAHDIGHAMQNMNLVACSAFGAWDDRTADSTLLLGRNFDFYVNDDFAANKILCFTRPDSGYSFVSVIWAGFAGVVSGMNEKGLTVTLNAAKSAIPFGARTPVSLLAREMLQYASDIREALEIAGSRETFVAESFLIGSAADGKAVVIEKSPEITAVYDPGADAVLVTNHFQSDAFEADRLNRENIANETSLYRLQRLRELVDSHPAMTVGDAAAILRDYRGMGGRDIGLGNEKAVNQFIAHHSVIFQPGSRQVWISSPPWQLGEYRGYRLDAVFGSAGAIPADQALYSPTYDSVIKYKALAEKVLEGECRSDAADSLIRYNPNFFQAYRILGDYYSSAGQKEAAMKYYRLALECEAPSGAEREAVSRRLPSAAGSRLPSAGFQQ